MKIYVLMNQNNAVDKHVCISEDINKIRKSICEDIDAIEDYPALEIWDNGRMIDSTGGSDVLRMIRDEIRLADE